MKSPANRISQSSSGHFRVGLLIIIAGTAFLLESSGVEARGYRYAGNRYGYWYGYGTGVGGGGASSATVPTGYIAALPAGAAPVIVFGKTYYFANGTYYSPEFYGGTTVYVVANP